MHTDNALDVRVATQPCAGWDDSVRRGVCGDLTLFHTSHWATRMGAVLGLSPIYLSVERGGEPLLRLLGFACLPWRQKGVSARLRTAAMALLRGRIGGFRWFGQPVCLSQAGEPEYCALAGAVRAHCDRAGLRLLGGCWPLQSVAALPRQWRWRVWATLLIDVSCEPEALFASFKPAARKAVRRAERDGVSVRRVASLQELEAYYAFAVACARRYRKRMYGFADFASMWSHIRPSGVFETFVAEKDGEMLAGLSLWGFGDTVAELGSFQSERSFSDGLFGPDLVKWAALQWAHGAGIRRFDLAGIDPHASEGKPLGIRRFKEKWGGQYCEYATIA